MSNAVIENSSDEARLIEGERHPFGGCNKFLQQYVQIGEALRGFERNSRRLSVGPESNMQSLRQALSFNSVEMLESYLDDLLDLDVPDSRLFIERHFLLNRSVPISLCGLLGAVLVGMSLAREGISLLISSLVTSSLSLPFLILFYVSPRGGMARRLMFAQVLSIEIARRRGRDKGGAPSGFSPSVILGGLFPTRATGVR